MITTNGADQQLGFFLGENDINPSYEAAEKKFVKPESLMPGDYIRVTLSNGVTSELKESIRLVALEYVFHI